MTKTEPRIYPTKNSIRGLTTKGSIVIDRSLNEGEPQDHGELATMIGERAERARDLYHRERSRVVRLNEDTFTVPGTAERHYRLRYGALVESCSCRDFEVHGSRLPCKHLQMLGIMFAARRQPLDPEVPEIPVAGDPFAYAGTKREVEK